MAKMERVAEGIYRRNGSYSVPIFDKASGRKVWHGPNCKGCSHVPIRSLDSARRARRTLMEEKDRSAGRADETVRGWGERWLTAFPRKAESTNVHNAERIRGFVSEFGDRSLRRISEQDAWAWADAHGSSVKEVRAMFNDAIKLRLCEVNPLEHYPVAARRGRRDIRVLSLRELDLLVACAREEWGLFGERMAGMIEMAAWTGVRPAELFLFSMQRGEHVNYVDRAGGLVDVQWQWNTKTQKPSRPKWGSERQVVLLPAAMGALERLLRDGAPQRDRLFVTHRGSAYTARTHHYYWHPVRVRFASNLPADHWLNTRILDAVEAGKSPAAGHLDFYELRHFFGTALAHPPAGVEPASPWEIAHQMGHSDIKMATEVYIHSEDQMVVSSLAAKWSGQAARKTA